MPSARWRQYGAAAQGQGMRGGSAGAAASHDRARNRHGTAQRHWAERGPGKPSRHSVAPGALVLAGAAAGAGGHLRLGVAGAGRAGTARRRAQRRLGRRCCRLAQLNRRAALHSCCRCREGKRASGVDLRGRAEAGAAAAAGGVRRARAPLQALPQRAARAPSSASWWAGWAVARRA